MIPLERRVGLGFSDFGNRIASPSKHRRSLCSTSAGKTSMLEFTKMQGSIEGSARLCFRASVMRLGIGS